MSSLPEMSRLTTAQRIVLVAYCLAIAYCSLWVPWYARLGPRYVRSGYGWLWAGPDLGAPRYALNVAPDLHVIGLRLLAATAIATACFVAAGVIVSPRAGRSVAKTDAQT